MHLTTRRATTGERLEPRPFPSPLRSRLCSAIATAHEQQPFSPAEVRQAANRVVALLERFGLQATMFRGGLDVGGAEIDHVWVVADGRVLDVAFPLFSPGFLECLRAYVAGDVDDDQLEQAAHPYSVRWRVVGLFPESCRYRGAPVWSALRGGSGPHG
jgi:hypothetical protein